MIDIDKGLPLPESAKNGKYKYPFHRMEVGDSFLWPPQLNPHSLHSMAAWASKRFGAKFVTRRTEEGFRCWRTA